MQKNFRLKDWIKRKLREFKIYNFYYFSLLDNFESILKNGILPLNEIKKVNPEYLSFAEESVQNRRDIKVTNGIQTNTHNLHNLVPIYLRTKTPTLYARKYRQDHIFFIAIQSFILLDDEIEYAFTDGNALQLIRSFITV